MAQGARPAATALPGRAGRRTPRRARFEDNVNEAVSGVKGELVIKVFGEDPVVLQRVADQVAGIVRDLPILGPSGEKLTLGSVADISVKPGFAGIYREENQRRIAVKLSVRGRDLGSLVADGSARVDRQLKLPPGYSLQWSGAFESQKRAQRRLLVIVPLTLVAIFFLLFTAFDSASLALLILLNVPFAAVGGIWAVAIFGLPLSVSAMVGFVALLGVSVMNGVLLVQRIRDLRSQGKSVLEAVSEGAASRFRPVLMTALMAELGLLPAALSTAVGAETQRPFAVVIIGGLVTATLLTLVVLPVLYRSFDTERPDY